MRLNPLSWITRKTGLLTLVSLILIAGGGLLYYVFSDRVRIEGILQSASETVETEDLEGLTHLLSDDYRDAYGQTRDSVHYVMGGVFRDFDRIQVDTGRPAIQLEGKSANVKIPIRVSAGWAGQRAYLVGSNPKPALATILFRKEGLLWRVVSVEGIK
jgi:hypothetical protein